MFARRETMTDRLLDHYTQNKFKSQRLIGSCNTVATYILSCAVMIV